MLFIEILIIVALLIGVAIGMWYERGRRGGTEQLRWQLLCARNELRQRRLASIDLRAAHTGGQRR